MKVYVYGCVYILRVLEVPWWIKGSYTQALDRGCHSCVLAEVWQKAAQKKRVLNELLGITIVEIQAEAS